MNTLLSGLKKILESKKVPVQLNKATYWKAESQPMTDGNQKKAVYYKLISTINGFKKV